MPLVRVRKTRTHVAGLVAVVLTALAASAAQGGTIFQQDFSSSNTVSSYFSATPNSGQFNDIAVNGSVTVAIPSGALAFTKTTGGSGAYARTSAFAPVPTAIVYKFRLAVTGNTAVQTNAGIFRVGSGFGTGATDENDNNTHSRLGVNFTA